MDCRRVHCELLISIALWMLREKLARLNQCRHLVSHGVTRERILGVEMCFPQITKTNFIASEAELFQCELLRLQPVYHKCLRASRPSLGTKKFLAGFPSRLFGHCLEACLRNSEWFFS